MPKKSVRKAKPVALSPAGKAAAVKKVCTVLISQYEYIPLEDLLKEQQDRVNVYGVLLDCSAPYYMETIKKHLCTAKLIDSTLHSGSGRVEFMVTTFFADKPEMIPQASKIGSIVRIHRGDLKMYNDTMQLNCDTTVKGAWVVFDPTDGVTPVGSSGKQFTFTLSDRETIKTLRKFSLSYFGKHELSATSLKDGEKKKKDFDCLCLVLGIQKKGDCDRVRLCDGERVVKMDIPIARKLHVSPEDVVRIRSANYAEGKDSRKLTLSEYSNILRVPKEFKSAKALLETLKHKDLPAHIVSELALHTPLRGAPLVISKTTSAHKHAKLVPLKDLFSGEALKDDKRFYKVHVSAIEVGPKDPAEWIWVADKTAQKQ